MNRLKFKIKGRTRDCCKTLGRFIIRGERLIKFSDSWFFAKPIDVGGYFLISVVKKTYNAFRARKII